MKDRIAPLNAPARLREVMHEVRSPLGGIRAMVQMLASTELTPEQREMVDALAASAAHLRAIADEVLGAGGDASAAVPRRLDAFLEALAVPARLRAGERGYRFTLEVEEGVCGAAAVGTPALRQVLENLIDNALRLTNGPVRLVVQRGEGARLRFALSDSGPGLSALQAERLIRAGGGIEGRPGGAGIGLTIAGRIVAQHGGRLEGGPGNDGEDGKNPGACFSFDWPDGSGSGQGGKPTCLVVDDHPASRLVLRTILGAAGYRVIEAAEPREALALFDRERPGIVISDLHMPSGGGQALMSRLAALAPDVRPRLIVVSADEVSADDPLHAMIAAQVRKPITVESVLNAVAMVAARAA